MTGPVLVDAAELRQLVPLDLTLVDRIERAFVDFGQGRVAQPPMLHLELPGGRGDIDAKAAAVAGSTIAAIKIAGYFPGNPEQGMAASQALVVVLSAETGEPIALLLDQSYLTDVRTAAAGAVAARLLAASDASVVAVLGTGVQAELQALAATLVRPVEEIRIWGRSKERAHALCERLQGATQARVVVVGLEQAVRGASIVVTTTSSREPVLPVELVEPGMHISAVGADLPGKRELGPGVLLAARVFCDARAQCAAVGELQYQPELPATELGHALDESVGGRRSDDEVTVADLTGLGVQDAAIAVLALERRAAATS